MEIAKGVKVLGSKRKQVVSCAAYLSGNGPTRTKFARVDGKNQECEGTEAHSRVCCSRKSLDNNYVSFVKSGLPRRLMFFANGEWSDFPDYVTHLLIEAFRVRKLAVEVTMDGCVHIVDFFHMVLINLNSGVEQSVAWIDESDKCFFPKLFLDGGDETPCHGDKIEITLDVDIKTADDLKSREGNEAVDIKTADDLKSREGNEAVDIKTADDLKSREGNEAVTPQLAEIRESLKAKEAIPESGVPHLEDVGFGTFDENLVRLERDGNDYLSVQDAFLRGLNTFVPPSNIIGIYRNSPTSGYALARVQAFEKQIEITERHRGDANVRRAWYGSSREGIVGLLLYGFGRTSKPAEGAGYGNGIYLAPEDCSYVSANYCDIDENGLQHMVLCRVIMGSMEKVQHGSEQFHPKCDEFDSGVDNLRNPKQYVIWGTHMNTHIHPEYVVSFKLPLPIRELLARVNDVQNGVDGIITDDKQATSTVHPVRDGPVKMPTSAWMPFTMLFAAIQNSISPLARDLLDIHYNAFKRKKLTREELIQKLRLIAGDSLLKSTLQRLQFQPPVNAQSLQQSLINRGNQT